MLLLVDDVKGGHSVKTTHEDIRKGGFTQSGSSGANDGRGYKWKFETKDGKAASFRIEGKEYDLSKGTLFVIKEKAEQADVRQFKRDLSTIPFDFDGCLEFLEKDDEIQKVFGADWRAK